MDGLRFGWNPSPECAPSSTPAPLAIHDPEEVAVDSRCNGLSMCNANAAAADMPPLPTAKTKPPRLLLRSLAQGSSRRSIGRSISPLFPRPRTALWTPRSTPSLPGQWPGQRAALRAGLERRYLSRRSCHNMEYRLRASVERCCMARQILLLGRRIPASIRRIARLRKDP